MALFSAEVSGEVIIDDLPADILQRLERRVEEKRLLGVESPVVFRIVDDDKHNDDSTYRKAARRKQRLHVEIASKFPALFEELTLDIGEGGHVRYCARFPKANRSTIVVGLGFGGAITAIGVFLAFEVMTGLVIVFAALGALIGALFANITSMDAKNRVPGMVLKILREETIEARRDERLRAELGLEKKMRIAEPETEPETEK